MSGIVTLLTDFGTADGYVAAMKGVILGINPSVTLVDVTHEIAPQQIRDAAFVLHSVHGYFPVGTVHLVVVDPGVGTDRAGVVVEMGGSYFVGPDNGLLSYLVRDAGAGAGGQGPGRRGDAGKGRHGDTERHPPSAREGGVAGPIPGSAGVSPAMRSRGDAAGHKTPPHDSGTACTGGSVACRPVAVPAGWRAVRIARSRYWLPKPSNTFHGRDIFAPVAAHLSLGEPMDSFGPQLHQVHAFEIPTPRPHPEGGLEGAVIHVDRYGNLVTNLQAGDLPSGNLVVEIGGRRIERLSRSYAGHGGLVALVDGHGYLEIALPNGSALEETGLGVGTTVLVSGAGTRP